MTDDALVMLLRRAGIASTAYWRAIWFEGCSLNRNILLCPNAETASAIDRLFLPQLRAVLTDLDVRIASQPTRSLPSAWKPAAPKAAYRGEAPTVEADRDLLE